MHHSAGCFYHAYNRTIVGRKLFPQHQNYEYLLKKVKESLHDYPLSIVAYCLMPNHYHFLLLPHEDNVLGSFFQKVFNGYAQAINQQEKMHGALFESSVKYCQVDSSPYLLQLIRYIHLNPVSAKLVKDPASWPFSNYAEWIGKRNGTLIDRKATQELFGTAEEYEQFVKEGMQGELSGGLLEFTLEKPDQKN